jgi:glycosyltransferase involved in cell wall biosynthesis
MGASGRGRVLMISWKPRFRYEAVQLLLCGDGDIERVK